MIRVSRCLRCAYSSLLPLPSNHAVVAAPRAHKNASAVFRTAQRAGELAFCRVLRLFSSKNYIPKTSLSIYFLDSRLRLITMRVFGAGACGSEEPENAKCHTSFVSTVVFVPRHLFPAASRF